MIKEFVTVHNVCTESVLVILRGIVRVIIILVRELFSFIFPEMLIVMIDWEQEFLSEHTLH